MEEGILKKLVGAITKEIRDALPELDKETVGKIIAAVKKAVWAKLKGK